MSNAIDELKTKLAAYGPQHDVVTDIAYSAIAHAEELEALVREFLSELDFFDTACSDCRETLKKLLARAKEVAGE